MRNLVSSTPRRVIAEIGRGDYERHCGLFCSPVKSMTIPLGVVWAADNGAYSYWSRGLDFDARAFIAMLKRFQGRDDCLFVVAPDMVGDADGTLLLFRAWVGTIRRYGFPVAFVLQNGARMETIPWDSFDALFIGGDTAFKVSATAAAFAREAKRRGKHVHMGRVNSLKRIQRAHEMGCDSFDGTGYAMFNSRIKKHIPGQVFVQQSLWEAIAC